MNWVAASRLYLIVGLVLGFGAMFLGVDAQDGVAALVALSVPVAIGLGVRAHRPSHRRVWMGWVGATLLFLTAGFVEVALVGGIRELGFHVDSASGFPIVNVILGPVDLVRRAAEILWEHEVLLTPAVFPATPLDRGGVRFTVTAANTEAEVGQVLDGMRAVREAIGVGRLPERDGAGRTRGMIPG